jgi:hypothetical protein
MARCLRSQLKLIGIAVSLVAADVAALRRQLE